MGDLQRFGLMAGALAVAMAVEAGRGSRLTHGAMAAMLAMLTIAFTWKRVTGKGSSLPGPTRLDALTAAIVLGSAGLAIALAYHVTGLKWHHGWQYALLFLLLAGAAYAAAERFTQDEGGRNLLRLLTLAQGIVASAGALYLVMSGKAWSPKVDWAAMHVMLGAAVALAAHSALVLLPIGRR